MNARTIIELEKKIVPEMFELIEKRYQILLNIFYYEPIGRRALANNLKLGERTIRDETSKLQEKNFIKIERQGMRITEDGKTLLRDLEQLIHITRGLFRLEIELEKKLSLKNVIIVPGNVEKNPKVLNLMGKTAADYIKDILKDNMIMGVTGGSSVSAIAKEMDFMNLKNVFVIPARGGMGKIANNQSNNIAAQLANKLHGNYELLHMPDDVEGEVLETLKENPTIKYTLEKLKKLDVLLIGIGRADKMIEKRGLSQKKREFLKQKNAVAEAFGHYFDKEGNVIYRSSSVGIGIQDLKKIPHVIAVAGGSDKAEAIKATCKIGKDFLLVTDESAAKAIIEK
ncbi:sugar-binding transcriptional regulator [Garciella nitratireducens]|uniref:Central glycolytic genes regulator n=1 Tax=Garciella nitratireducens DSM 15102 TaxID=1121911 RepID=A0A1T4KL32_9FIRM|nr:sugar-binding domain-containing protein [Garciella nitratireducens]RBP41604.1 central glycolytic genes regulator [Garciella nitratireducens]SJZ43098.1 central glycolytic genes regulator [Garciella nitratireducens DSM 15102]